MHNYDPNPVVPRALTQLHHKLSRNLSLDNVEKRHQEEASIKETMKRAVLIEVFQGNDITDMEALDNLYNYFEGLFSKLSYDHVAFEMKRFLKLFPKFQETLTT